jgi:hypothetical protein
VVIPPSVRADDPGCSLTRNIKPAVPLYSILRLSGVDENSRNRLSALVDPEWEGLVISFGIKCTLSSKGQTIAPSFGAITASRPRLPLLEEQSIMLLHISGRIDGDHRDLSSPDQSRYLLMYGGRCSLFRGTRRMQWVFYLISPCRVHT